MKRRGVLLFFALLDAIVVVRFAPAAVRQSLRILTHAKDWPPIVGTIETARVVLIAALILGAVGLCRQWKGMAAFNAAQLPLRLFFAVLGEGDYLSFGFLRALGPLFPPWREHHRGLLGAAALLEISRAVLVGIIAWRWSRARRCSGPHVTEGGAG